MEKNSYQPEQISIAALNIPLEMYTLANQKEAISQRSFNRYVNCHKQNSDIEKSVIKIEDNNFDVRKFPIEDRSEVIKKRLENEDVEDQIETVSMIKYVPNSERTALVRQALASESILVKKAAVMKISYVVPEEERAGLVRQILNGQNIELYEKAASAIYFCQRSERKELRKKTEEIIKENLNSKDIKFVEVAALMINYAPKLSKRRLRIKVEEIIKENFDGDDAKAHRVSASMIECAPKSSREKLFNYAVSKKLFDALTLSRLYDHVDFSKNSRLEEFQKDGSRTEVFIDDLLRKKSIIRYIKPEHFLAWQKTYENHEAWQKAGFDYVPVEPIQFYRFDAENKLVEVFSGVLDLDLGDWLKRSSLFEKELIAQKNKIINILLEQKIEHGHPHFGNFSLSFFRKEDGSPDFTKVPRLYIIDFDQAIAE